MGGEFWTKITYIFDIGAWVNGNHVAMLYAEVVADNSVDAGAAVIKLLVGEDNEDGILALLAANQDGITAEELEFVHGSLGQGNDAVVIVDGIGDPEGWVSIYSVLLRRGAYIN